MFKDTTTGEKNSTLFISQIDAVIAIPSPIQYLRSVTQTPEKGGGGNVCNFGSLFSFLNTASGSFFSPSLFSVENLLNEENDEVS